MKQFSLLMFALMLIPIIGLAQDIVDPPLENPVLEARAIELHKRLRCMVCQNQSIHESNAELARDLRIVVRERLAAGDSDEQAIQMMNDEVIVGGMIPKINTCIDTVNNGVRGVVIIDGRRPHSILYELFSDQGSGTLIRK